VRWKGEHPVTALLPEGPVLINPGDTFLMPLREAKARSDVEIVDTAENSAKRDK
jgi:hypothetical protein